MSLGLLGTYDSSSSSSEEEEREQPIPQTLSNPFASNSSSLARLPKPSFMVETEDKISSSVKVQNSVFNNPFRDKEDQKRAILEKHVEMTVKQEDLKTINGRKVCWNFRKGRCRFGHKCTFAHDSDVKVTSANQTPDPVAEMAEAAVSSAPKAIQLADSEYESGAVISAEDSQGMVRKKKRPGLSDDLVPGKKAMKFYNKVYKQ